MHIMSGQKYVKSMLYPMHPYAVPVSDNFVKVMKISKICFLARYTRITKWTYTNIFSSFQVTAYKCQTDTGLKNMVGNVWEWVSDWWQIKHEKKHTADPVSIYNQYSTFFYQIVWLQLSVCLDRSCVKNVIP